MQFVQSTFLLCRFLVQLIFYSFTIVILFYFILLEAYYFLRIVYTLKCVSCNFTASQRNIVYNCRHNSQYFVRIRSVADHSGRAA